MSLDPTATTPVRPSIVRLPKSKKLITGMVFCAVLAVTDLGELFGMNGPEPAAVDIAGGTLGIVTIVALILIGLGRLVVGGVVVAVVARVLSGLLAVPAFFADLPAGLLVTVAGFLVLTLLGVSLLVAGLRSDPRG